MTQTTEPIELEQPSNALVRLDDNPAYLMRRATDVAGVSRDIVMKTAIAIQGRKYVKVEGWQAIAIAHGCIASSRDVERIESGFRAIGEVRRMSDGIVLATAEGFVGDDEVKTWGQRPEYAKRAMAQTRAISRACRSAFAHVVVLIDANLSTTPAEEMPLEQSEKPTKTPPRATGASSKGTLAATGGTGKPFKSKTDLVRILGANPEAAVAVLRLNGVLLDTETLDDFPEHKLPQNATEMNALLVAISNYVDNSKPDPQDGPEQDEFAINPGPEPAWKSHKFHFGPAKGTTLGEFARVDSKKFYGWVMNYNPSADSKGNPKNPSPEDMALRDALDEAKKYMEARK